MDFFNRNVSDFVTILHNSAPPSPNYVKFYHKSVFLSFPSTDSCNAKSFEVTFKKGDYKIELCGGKGGGSAGGNGGFVSGLITFFEETKLYFFIGAKGSTKKCVTFGGGGIGGLRETYSWGGASDIRTHNSATYEDNAGLISRIMVAGGGGASNIYSNSKDVLAGVGGGLKGGERRKRNWN